MPAARKSTISLPAFTPSPYQQGRPAGVTNCFGLPRKLQLDGLASHHLVVHRAHPEPRPEREIEGIALERRDRQVVPLVVAAEDRQIADLAHVLAPLRRVDHRVEASLLVPVPPRLAAAPGLAR